MNVGAKVVFGDVAIKPAEALVEQLSKSGSAGEISFIQCDVTKYDDIYKLFKTARDKYSCIDHAVSCAGIFEQGAWFDPDLTVETVGQEQAPTAVIDVNLMGSANFARIAVVFLRDGLKKGGNRSLTLLSSVNAFRESPGIYMYQVSQALPYVQGKEVRFVTAKLEQSDIETCDSGSHASNAQTHL